MRALIAILILVTFALAGSLFYRHTQALKQSEKANTTIKQLSTKAETTEKELGDQIAVNKQLEEELNAKARQLADTSNTLMTVSATLAKVREEAQAAATNAAADLAKRDSRINELETQRDDLTKRMTDLNGQITGL